MSGWGTFPRPAKGLGIVSASQQSGWLLHHGLGLYIIMWFRRVRDFGLRILQVRHFSLGSDLSKPEL